MAPIERILITPPSPRLIMSGTNSRHISAGEKQSVSMTWRASSRLPARKKRRSSSFLAAGNTRVIDQQAGIAGLFRNCLSLGVVVDMSSARPVNALRNPVQ